MATGKSDSFILDCTSSFFELCVNWKETYDASTNKSTVTISSVEFRSSGWCGFTYYPDGIIKVNGVAVITMNSNLADHNCRADSLNSWTKIKKSGGADATGSIDIVHDADGRKSITIEVVGNRFSQCYFYTREGDGGSGWGCTGSKSIDLTTIATYTLSISAGAGSSITVNRTSSGYAGTGNISAETRLYYGDKLKISFLPNTNYRLVTTTVNGSAFTSGNTHTVAANVAVASTAQVLASAVGATDANIGSTSTITVTKYNPAYYHSLQYSFGSISGYITSSGGIQSSEVKFSGTSIAFTLPSAFYEQIPNAKTGVCTITCRTYSSSSSTTVLGNATTCTFTATATGSPSVSSAVIDTNSTTIALTGNSSTLIRYRSNPKCTITATPKNSASISTVKICGTAMTGITGSNGVVTAEKSYSNASYTSYAFAATDSRGYSTSKTVSPTVVGYVELTCFPSISRPTPTGNSIVMSASGTLYRGSFGVASNELVLEYRYKTTDGSYSSWYAVPSSNISLGSSKYTLNDFSLGEDFDYKMSYVFQIRACDGGTVGGTRYTLSTVTKTIEVQKGIPIFDWGESDFAFHTPVNMNGNRINNFIEMGQWLNKSVDDLPLNSVAWVAPSTIGLPYSGSGIYGYIETWAAYRSIYFQRISYLSGRCYIRMYYNAVWHDWVRVDVGTVTLDSLGAEANLSNGTYTGSLDSIAENGIVWINGSSISGSPTGAYSFVETWCSGANTRFQRLTTTTGHVCQRQYHTSAWTTWEWMNPPMTTGVTYRTTERWNGYPVYVRNVSCGTLTEGRKVVSVSDLANSRIIEARGYATDSSGASYLIPSINYDMTDSYTVVLLVNTHSSGGDIQIFSGSSIAGKTAYVQIRFIKP